MLIYEHTRINYLHVLMSIVVCFKSNFVERKHYDMMISLELYNSLSLLSIASTEKIHCACN